jgi:NAD-dependent dihydropyrimidine dehydrogenase PreA subunit
MEALDREVESPMTYVIGEPCVDVKDRACVDECPVDCIYEGKRMLYIHPDECVDCGACEPVCPVEAIYYEDDLPAELEPYKDDNARFFTEALPGRTEPLGSPGGAAKLGAIGIDTELVASQPPRED